MKIPFMGGMGRGHRNVMTLRLFDSLEFKCTLIPFGNGYAASVLCTHKVPLTYEVTVMWSNVDSRYSKVDDTHITNDVIANLTYEGLEKALQQIRSLPRRS